MHREIGPAHCQEARDASGSPVITSLITFPILLWLFWGWLVGRVWYPSAAITQVGLPCLTGIMANVGASIDRARQKVWE